LAGYVGNSQGEEQIAAAVSEELEHIWSRVQAELARSVDETTYRIWLRPLQPRELSGGCLLVEAPPDACAWICDRFGRVVQASATIVLGADTLVEFVARQAPQEAALGGSPASLRARPASLTRPREERLSRARASHNAPPAARADPLDNPKLTFEQFVIGDCNRLAHAAALTVAEMPAQAYNPLFICGPPGVGKTHLLGAIASLARSHSPRLSLRCTTGEAFTNEFLGALADGNTDSFKARFRDVDVLLLDDVQFLERKTKTEEEFFHTFNALHDGGRQIVLTSDRPPRDLRALEDRLRERFQAGLVADITPPELATRLAILRKRVQYDRIELADERVLGMLSERVQHNVRALEGALIRVVAYGSLTGRPLTAELTGQVLDKLYPSAGRHQPAHAHTIAEIQAAACAFFGVSLEALNSSGRRARIAWPRQVAMYLARELTAESLPSIGRCFGGRDHTTVLHAWRRTTARLAEDDTARQSVEKLCEGLGCQPISAHGSPDRSP
jgi:chromosomal replication initiator protein